MTYAVKFNKTTSTHVMTLFAYYIIDLVPHMYSKIYPLLHKRQ